MPTTPTAPAFTYLTDDEAAALRYATTPTVAMERIELLCFLGYPDTLPPTPEARTLAVVNRILETRGARPTGLARTDA